MAQQTTQRQRFHALLLKVDVQATTVGIQLYAHLMARQFGGHRVALEINAEHAMAVDFAFHMQAIQLVEPASGIDRAGQWG